MSGVGKTVCVTGAAGFVASHLVKLLLQQGYYVKASVRSLNNPSKTEHLLKLDGAKKRLHLFEADLLEEGSFDAAIDGCDGVFHTASPFFNTVTDPQKELIEPALKGTLNVLGSCSKAPSVQRVVVTSSLAAVVFNARPKTPEVIVDETWFSDPELNKEMKLWYVLSKTLAEDAAWKFAEEKGLDIVTINPAMVIGPLLQSTLNTSAETIANLLNGSETYPNSSLGWVNVQDVAKAHVQAFEIPSANGRYCLVESVAHYSELVEILRKLYPASKFPEKCADHDNVFTPATFQVSKEKAKSLGIDYITLEQSIKETVESLKEKNFGQGRFCALPEVGDVYSEKPPTPILDTIETPMHLKNLTHKELKQLADDLRSELSFIRDETQKSVKASVSVVELTIAIHRVFSAPMDKILWDVGEQTYAHKILTGRRSAMQTLRQKNGISGYTCRSESEFDPFGAGHGCNSISAGLGLAIARDIKGKRERIVAVISNESTMAGQLYEAMSNAGYLDSDMIVILNDSRQSLHPKLEEAPKTPINALSSAFSKLQSSKLFRKYREAAKGLTKRIGKGMYEWAAKVDEYARGMMGPLGSTLYEELGLYYIGPVDGHNIEDLICVLNQVASLDSTGPVLVHVITKEDKEVRDEKQIKISNKYKEDPYDSDPQPSSRSKTYSDRFAEALTMEAQLDKDIMVVHAGMGMEPPLKLFQEQFPDRLFDVGMAEQHAVTFSAGLSCGGLKPFCIIPSTFLQRAYDQVVHDVDRQKIPVRFVIPCAGLVGSDGPTNCGAFDITYMSCLPNMIVMAPSDEVELANMVATASCIDDRPVCFRYPRGAIVRSNSSICHGVPIEIGKGRVLVEGKDIALLGYGSMVQNCLRAQSLLSELGIDVTVADARFCKPLDIKLVRQLCENHAFLITVEEGSIGGFGSHVAQFITLDGRLDGSIKWRPIVLPDNYVEQASPMEQLSLAGLTGHHIAATALNLLGRTREALLLMR